jgi:L-ascorbate metabolism protein UlaG (beta-lactamase superfamily)
VRVRVSFSAADDIDLNRGGQRDSELTYSGEFGAYASESSRAPRGETMTTNNLRLERFITCCLVTLAAAPVAAQHLMGDEIATDKGPLIIHPINHATFAMAWNGTTIYNDPVGGAEAYAGLPAPDLILISDVHGDHLDADTLHAIVESDTKLLAPSAVADMLPGDLRAMTTVLANGESTSIMGLGIEAIPMYNTTEDRLQFHTKGRGNGYVLNMGGKRVYISGDTEDIPEMRALENIDVAFVCFNLPYTMTEEQAASAVREFAPDIVYPYHYRGSDVDKFERLVGSDSGIEVRRGDWY